MKPPKKLIYRHWSLLPYGAAVLEALEEAQALLVTLVGAEVQA